MSQNSLENMSPKMRFFVSKIFPCLFMFAGAVATYLGCLYAVQAQEINSWPTTKGTIRQSFLQQNPSEKGSKPYQARINYDFSVDEKTYTGGRIYYSDYDSSSSLQEAIKKYPVAKEVKVYYQKSDPRLNVLEPGINGHIYALPIIGLLFVCVGIFMLIYLTKLAKKAVLSKKESTDDTQMKNEDL